MASGYLKAEKHWFDAENEGEQYRLCLTNQEADRADAPNIALGYRPGLR